MLLSVSPAEGDANNVVLVVCTVWGFIFGRDDEEDDGASENVIWLTIVLFVACIIRFGNRQWFSRCPNT